MSTENNAVIEDFLDEDTEIPGQRYVLLSFLSPEKVLDKKELFFFQKFLHAYEVEWKIKNLEKFLVDTVKNINDQLDDRSRELEKNDQMEAAAICRKNRLRIDDVMSQYGSFVQKSKADLNKTKIVEAYEDFMYTHKSKLEEDFYALNDSHTSIRGIKVRGVFGNVKEAELKAKKLQRQDKYHNIFMAEVGKWTPWDPQPHEVKDQEYNNDQLNSLMKKYKENEDNREQFFEERTKNAKTLQSDSSGQFDSMFGVQGDLAHQRKMERAAVTVERIEEPVPELIEEKQEEPKNVVIEPKVEAKVEAKVEPKVEAKVEAKVETKVEAKKEEPKVEAKKEEAKKEEAKKEEAKKEVKKEEPKKEEPKKETFASKSKK